MGQDYYVVTFSEWVGGSRVLCRDVLSGLVGQDYYVVTF